MKRFGLALTLFVSSALAAPEVHAAPTLVAKAKSQKKKAAPAGEADEKSAGSDSRDERPLPVAAPAVAEETAPERPVVAHGKKAVPGAPMVVALVGANTRTRTSDVTFFDGSSHYSRNWIYPELSARALVRPWVNAAGAQRNVRFDAEFAHSVGASATSDTSGRSHGVSSWRLALDAAYLFEHLLGEWDLGLQAGLGVDRFAVDINNPDYVPSNRLSFLRAGLLARRPVGERIFLDVAAAYHLVIGMGLSGHAANYDDSSGAYGFDAGAGLSGGSASGDIRFVWSLRLTYQRHGASFSNSNATSFSQNDLLASAQVGASFR